MSDHAIPPAQNASQTLAALERYQTHVRRLVANWQDPALYHEVSQDMEQVRRCCRQLSALSDAWVSLLIAHAELMHALWQVSRMGSKVDGEERTRLLAAVDQRVRAAQDICMRMLAPGASRPF